MTDLRVLEIDYTTPPVAGSIAYFNGFNWVSVSGSSLVASPDGSVQYNSGGVLTGSSKFTYSEDGSGIPIFGVTGHFGIDAQSGSYYFGDVGGSANGNVFLIDDASSQFLFQNNANNGRIDMQAATSGAGPAYFNFLADVEVPDDSYSATWDGDLSVPTKNAVYDKIETIAGGGASLQKVRMYAVAL